MSTIPSTTTRPQRPGLAYDADGSLLIDVRGPRFGAAITTAVLATALILQGTIGTALVAWQVTVFAIATIAGLAYSPYGLLFRIVKQRFDLGAPLAVEHEQPPRFAQACGLAVAGVGLVALLGGATTVGWVAVGIVLALSTLLATTGLCVGCELYLLMARARATTARKGG